jgi:multimeric flavodoxin WrbA
MKVLGINGSPRKDSNTAIIIGHIFQELHREGIETELFQFAGKTIRGCTACLKCRENKDKRCSVTNDCFNDLFAKMCEADGVIIGSPTYVAGVTAEIKALIDRSTYVALANDGLLKRKVGAAVSAVRRAGSITAIDTINHFLVIAQMIIPGSSYWPLVIGRNIGEVEADEEGIRCMHVLGENIAWLLKKINA